MRPKFRLKFNSSNYWCLANCKARDDLHVQYTLIKRSSFSDFVLNFDTVIDLFHNNDQVGFGLANMIN